MYFTPARPPSDVEPGQVEAHEEDDPRSPAGQAVPPSGAPRGRETDGQAPRTPAGRPGLRRRDTYAAGARGYHRTQAAGPREAKEDGEGPRGIADLAGEGRDRGHRWRHGKPRARLVGPTRNRTRAGRRGRDGPDRRAAVQAEARRLSRARPCRGDANGRAAAANGAREGRGDRAREGERGPRSPRRGPAPEGRDHRGDVRLRQAEGARSDQVRSPDGDLRGRRRRSVGYPAGGAADGLSRRAVARVREPAVGVPAYREGRMMASRGETHTYPLHQQDLETMHAYYEELGEIPPANGFYGWWR